MNTATRRIQLSMYAYRYLSSREGRSNSASPSRLIAAAAGRRGLAAEPDLITPGGTSTAPTLAASSATLSGRSPAPKESRFVHRRQQNFSSGDRVAHRGVRFLFDSPPSVRASMIDPNVGSETKGFRGGSSGQRRLK